MREYISDVDREPDIVGMVTPYGKMKIHLGEQKTRWKDHVRKGD